jgi:hypothetical protein
LLTQKFLEAVEDEIEAELALLAVVVAGLECVLTGQLGEARVLLRGELQQKGLRELGGLSGGAKRETPFLQCKSVDVAVEGCERVCPSRFPDSTSGDLAEFWAPNFCTEPTMLFICSDSLNVLAQNRWAVVTVASWTLSVQPTCPPRVGLCARSVIVIFFSTFLAREHLACQPGQPSTPPCTAPRCSSIRR